MLRHLLGAVRLKRDPKMTEFFLCRRMEVHNFLKVLIPFTNHPFPFSIPPFSKVACLLLWCDYPKIFCFLIFLKVSVGSFVLFINCPIRTNFTLVLKLSPGNVKCLSSFMALASLESFL